MRHAVLIVLLLTVVPAGVAQARPKLTTPEDRLAASLSIAQRAFPSACTGREQVSLTALDRTLNGFVYNGDTDCRVVINSSLPPIAFCSTLTHELGHLAGRGHETDGIMAPLLVRYQPCENLIKVTIAEARLWLLRHKRARVAACMRTGPELLCDTSRGFWRVWFDERRLIVRVSRAD